MLDVDIDGIGGRGGGGWRLCLFAAKAKHFFLSSDDDVSVRGREKN